MEKKQKLILKKSKKRWITKALMIGTFALAGAVVEVTSMNLGNPQTIAYAATYTADNIVEKLKTGTPDENADLWNATITSSDKSKASEVIATGWDSYAVGNDIGPICRALEVYVNKYDATNLNQVFYDLVVDNDKSTRLAQIIILDSHITAYNNGLLLGYHYGQDADNIKYAQFISQLAGTHIRGDNARVEAWGRIYQPMIDSLEPANNGDDINLDKAQPSDYFFSLGLPADLSANVIVNSGLSASQLAEVLVAATMEATKVNSLPHTLGWDGPFVEKTYAKLFLDHGLKAEQLGSAFKQIYVSFPVSTDEDTTNPARIFMDSMHVPTSTNALIFGQMKDKDAISLVNASTLTNAVFTPTVLGKDLINNNPAAGVIKNSYIATTDQLATFINNSRAEKNAKLIGQVIALYDANAVAETEDGFDNDAANTAAKVAQVLNGVPFIGESDDDLLAVVNQLGPTGTDTGAGNQISTPVDLAAFVNASKIFKADYHPKNPTSVGEALTYLLNGITTDAKITTTNNLGTFIASVNSLKDGTVNTNFVANIASLMTNITSIGGAKLSDELKGQVTLKILQTGNTAIVAKDNQKLYDFMKALGYQADGNLDAPKATAIGNFLKGATVGVVGGTVPGNVANLLKGLGYTQASVGGDSTLIGTMLNAAGTGAFTAATDDVYNAMA